MQFHPGSLPIKLVMNVWKDIHGPGRESITNRFACARPSWPICSNTSSISMVLTSWGDLCVVRGVNCSVSSRRTQDGHCTPVLTDSHSFVLIPLLPIYPWLAPVIYPRMRFRLAVWKVCHKGSVHSYNIRRTYFDVWHSRTVFHFRSG